MHEKMEKIEDIDRITMYKMVKALYKYDYFSTKCFVNELLKKRKNKQEIKDLNKIKELLFCQDDGGIEEKLNELIDEKESAK